MQLKRIGVVVLATIAFVIGTRWSVIPLTPLTDSTISGARLDFSDADL